MHLDIVAMSKAQKFLNAEKLLYFAGHGEIRVLGPNSWASTCHVWPLSPVSQINSMVKGRERRFITLPSKCTMGRGKVSTQPIFSHL
jgi:hypothetical protein